jgi:secreted PhoX family phosphatase
VRHSRRDAIRFGLAYAAGFTGLASLLNRAEGWARAHPAEGFGPLVPDPRGVIDLPEGFSYEILSPVGEEMDDGLLVPGKHDGMAAFSGEDGRIILVRNHELQEDWRHLGPFGRDNQRLARVPKGRMFDRGFERMPSLGGTTTIIYNPATRKVEHQFMSLIGTSYNCAGGATPWGTWLTCEETTIGRGEGLERDHGWVFEVSADATEAVEPVPLESMGRFRHEAVAVDIRNGCVYLTEDVGDGVFYRFVMHEPASLRAGGRLQALAVAGCPALDTRNWKGSPVLLVGQRLLTRWVDLDDVRSARNDLRLRAAAKGAAVFARCEGIWWDGGSAYFAATTGGAKQLGQIWKFTPEGEEGSLELMLESQDAGVINNADNITAAPWGDLIVCEDGQGRNGLVGVTPRGEVYRLAMLRRSGTETAGATFSPDGSILFINEQTPGRTLAIRGAWGNRGR